MLLSSHKGGVFIFKTRANKKVLRGDAGPKGREGRVRVCRIGHEKTPNPDSNEGNIISCIDKRLGVGF